MAEKNTQYREFAQRFGKHLRKLRKERKLSQDELAKRSQCNISFIGSIERGQKAPTLLTLAKIADGLKVHITRLFELSEERDPHREFRDILEDRFYALMKNASEDTLKLLAEILGSVLTFEKQKQPTRRT